MPCHRGAADTVSTLAARLSCDEVLRIFSARRRAARCAGEGLGSSVAVATADESAGADPEDFMRGTITISIASTRTAPAEAVIHVVSRCPRRGRSGSGSRGLRAGLGLGADAAAPPVSDGSSSSRSSPCRNGPASPPAWTPI
jgi:hypothetical protein